MRDGRTDGPTDGRTDGWTDTPSYGDATAHLKRISFPDIGCTKKAGRV